MENTTADTGVIVTFYSYKGGTGRSMALANCAFLAAQATAAKGRVLMIDWDLEAPGLHRYFPESEQGENALRPGVIDYFTRLSELLTDEIYGRLCGVDGGRELARILPLDDYVVPAVAEGLDLMKAGAFLPDYPNRIATFDWAEFFRRYPRVYRAFRSYLTNRYSWCFIDSRTGLSDVSGVSTMIMAEKLVAVFTPNRQSLDGAIELSARAVEYRRNSDDPRPLAVFPLPSRIVTDEHKLLKTAQERYRDRFEEFFRISYGLEKCDMASYFSEVAVPHKGFYGFHELVAVRDEPETTDALSINRAYERFFQRLNVLDSAWDQMPDAPFAQPALSPRAAATAGTAFSEGFENDIFVSYAHADDEPFAGEDGFVSRLSRDLQIRLPQLLGKRVRIWRDAKLFGTDEFSDEMSSVIKNSAVLIPVVSPAYVNSEWCGRELHAFLDRGGGETQRVSPVFLGKVDRGLLPANLQRLTGLQFPLFATDSDSREYRTCVNALAQSVAAMLQATADEPAKPRRTVYLADTTSDVRGYRDRLRLELEGRGYRVVPESALPLASDELLPTVDREMADSELSIHIVGSRSGFVPEGETRSISELQFDAATRAGIRRIVWAQRETGPFPEWLQPQSREGQVEIVETGFAEFLTVTLDCLEQRSVPKAAGKGLPQVFIICDAQDLDLATEVQSWMFEQGFETTLPLLEGTPDEMHRDRVEAIRSADGTAIVWRLGSEAWFRIMLREVRNARKADNNHRKPCLVYIPEELSEAQRKFESHEAGTLRNSPVSGLKTFLEQVRRGTPG